jgi:hypothetical protein
MAKKQALNLPAGIENLNQSYLINSKGLLWQLFRGFWFSD